MADSKLESSVKTVAEVVSGVLEKAPIYEDAAQPALREIGQGLGGMLKLVVLPLKMMGYKADKLLEDFQERLEQKGKNIQEENLQAPDPTIAGPIIQSLGYTLHKEPLREMFTNLLISGMDKSKNADVHPGFVEIIKQVSSDEAKILQRLISYLEMTLSLEGDKIKEVKIGDRYSNIPIVNVIKFINKPLKTVFMTNVCLLAQEADCEFPGNESVYIDNLLRLGIIRLRSNVKIGNGESNRKIDEWFINFKLSNEGDFELEYGILEITNFGYKFISTCVLDIEKLMSGEYGDFSETTTPE